MTVQEVWIPAGGRRRDALLAGALCNDARLEWRAGAPAAQGDPTEGALIVAAAREGLDRNKLDEQWPRQEELPFDSGRKLMSTIHPRPEGGFRVFVKGAPDVLLERCAAGPQGVLSPPGSGRGSSGPTRRWPGGLCGCWGWPAGIWPSCLPPWSPGPLRAG